MSSVAQILDRTNNPVKPDAPRERKEFKAEWKTVHTAVVKAEGEIITGVEGFALDEYEGRIIAEVRKSNNFPIPRYEVFVGLRRRGRTVPAIGLRTSTKDGVTTMETDILARVAEGFQVGAVFAAQDLAQELAKPNVKKALQFREKRAREEEAGVSGLNQANNAGHRKTGKTERDRLKKAGAKPG